jgi:hypothetical protein
MLALGGRKRGWWGSGSIGKIYITKNYIKLILLKMAVMILDKN